MLPYYHRGMNFGQSWSYYLWAGKLPRKTIPSFTSDSKLLDKALIGFLTLLSNVMIGPLDLRSSLQYSLFSLIFCSSISFRLNICAYPGTCKVTVANFITTLLNRLNQ
ncbi:hypothetical protein M9H77_23556 [Catharanthus roseus]|uniref:Uncharacterized protein n=1 Tax=Catharanthus roseus TaxID=4058 RepID=A0ACC0AWH6_CATRO|nr:hypothetical protein M9H77_23556 [Catharanthus roseus]